MHTQQRLASAAIVVLSLWLGWPTYVFAQSDAQQHGPGTPAQQPSAEPSPRPTPAGLTGDWGGERTRLGNAGIVVRGHIVSEFAGNPAGGLQQGTALASELMLGTDINFGQLDHDGAGTMHFTFTAREGSSLSSNAIGNVLPVQEIFGDGLTPRLTEFSYEQPLLNGKLNVELGRLITENDFAYGPTYWGGNLFCNYQSNAICGTPIAAPIDSGYVAYPSSAWGVRARVLPTKNWYLEGAAYQVNPTYGESGEGFNLGFAGDTGTFLPFETGFSFTDTQGTAIGNLRLGAYYDTSVSAAVESQITRVVPSIAAPNLVLPDNFYRGRHGYWIQADHLIAGHANPGSAGTVAFVNYEGGDPQTALITNFYDAGIIQHGPIPGRPNDTLTLGYAIANFNPRLRTFEQTLQAIVPSTPITGNESILELNYGLQVTPWMTLRPGVQYVMDPSGNAAIPHALVLDLSTTINF
jgi:porin